MASPSRFICRHTLRRRRLCGLSLFALRASADIGGWQGRSYSPEDGNDYLLSARLEGDRLVIDAVVVPPTGADSAAPLNARTYALRRTSDPGQCTGHGR